MLCRNGFQRLVYHPNVHTAPQFVHRTISHTHRLVSVLEGEHHRTHAPHTSRSFSSYAPRSRTKIIRVALKRGNGGTGKSRFGVFRFQTQAQLDRLLQRSESIGLAPRQLRRPTMWQRLRSHTFGSNERRKLPVYGHLDRLREDVVYQLTRCITEEKSLSLYLVRLGGTQQAALRRLRESRFIHPKRADGRPHVKIGQARRRIERKKQERRQRSSAFAAREEQRRQRERDRDSTVGGAGAGASKKLPRRHPRNFERGQAVEQNFLITDEKLPEDFDYQTLSTGKGPRVALPSTPPPPPMAAQLPGGVFNSSETSRKPFRLPRGIPRIPGVDYEKLFGDESSAQTPTRGDTDGVSSASEDTHSSGRQDSRDNMHPDRLRQQAKGRPSLLDALDMSRYNPPPRAPHTGPATPSSSPPRREYPRTTPPRTSHGVPPHVRGRRHSEPQRSR